jgi:AbrB family looped-hinge helix DNA binding protein
MYNTHRKQLFFANTLKERFYMIDISRVTTEGQVTIPYEFRKKLDIKEGDKIVFIEKDGLLFLGNSNRLVLEDYARSMAGEAEKAGIKTEEDVMQFVREIRGEIWEQKYAGND